MSFWSRVKNIAKKALHIIKAVVRVVVRIIAIVLSIPFKAFDLVFGWFGWPRKKLKIHIAVLRTPNGPLIPYDKLETLWPSIDLLKKTFKDHGNVEVRPYSSGNKREIDNWAQIVEDVAPHAALNVDCGWGSLWNEFGEAGDFFAKHSAGSVGGIPISLAFPVTIFVVEDVLDKAGCAVPLVTDYCTVEYTQFMPIDGSTPAHEVGHLCNLWHSGQHVNLMFANRPERYEPYWLHWWQRNLVRSSRHVTYLF
jgi:hypothetical protein